MIYFSFTLYIYLYNYDTCSNWIEILLFLVSYPSFFISMKKKTTCERLLKSNKNFKFLKAWMCWKFSHMSVTSYPHTYIFELWELVICTLAHISFQGKCKSSIKCAQKQQKLLRIIRIGWHCCIAAPCPTTLDNKNRYGNGNCRKSTSVNTTFIRG